MPRIKAASVAEHVAEQEAAVFAAAIRLFIARGYDNVSLADIASEIGLARSSLYRYFPDKAHILLRWFQQEMPRQVARSEAILRGSGEPDDRIERWALDQLDYAAGPEHDLIARIGALVPELDDTARAELASSHDMLLAPLLDALGEAGIARGAERRVVAEIVQQLVLSAARAAEPASRRISRDASRRYLVKAIRGLLS
jgi:AcrR family transcriptional regulator